MVGTLYVVATPLGNRGDLGQRAAQILGRVNVIVCEDTRHTRKLAQWLGIHVPLTSYHEHNETTKAPRLVAELKRGRNLAIVCDAGTPLISDPGYRLVSLCRKERIPVVPVPGPSAAVAALSVSGLPNDRFFFVGFLDRRVGAQETALRALIPVRATLILYLSPHGLRASLRRIAKILGNRRAFLIREMTKIHETSYYGRLQDILTAVEKEPVRGEFTLVLKGASKLDLCPSRLDVEAYFYGLTQLRGLSRKRAIQTIVQELGVPKRKIYPLFNP